MHAFGTALGLQSKLAQLRGSAAIVSEMKVQLDPARVLIRTVNLLIQTQLCSLPGRDLEAVIPSREAALATDLVMASKSYQKRQTSQ